MLPEAAVAGDPGVGLAHRAHDEPAAAHAAILAAVDQAGVFQDAQVPGDGGERNAEGAGQGADRLLPGRELRQHGAARRIGEGGERGVEGSRLILNHIVKYR